MKERLLDAVEQIVIWKGVGALSLELTARTAGVSKGGLLYHFSTKEALLVALVERYRDRYQSLKCLCADTCNGDTVGSRLGTLIADCLADPRRAQALGAELLAIAALAPNLLEQIREANRKNNGACTVSARADVVVLAVEGLMLREALRISSFSSTQREGIIAALQLMAEGI